jgi:outer membrane protein assembly factor BamE (lipoprotein component of BamABCDE complex)
MKRIIVFISIAVCLIFQLNGFSTENKVCDFLKNSLPKFGNTKDEIIKNLGKPDNISIQEFDSMWYPGEKDYVNSLSYSGFLLETIYIYQKENTFEYTLTVEVTSEEYVLYYGLRVGSTKKDVLSTLGNPEEISEEEKYWLYSCKVEKVYFYFQGDKVIRIACHGYFP